MCITPVENPLSIWNDLVAGRPPSDPELALAEEMLSEYAERGYLHRTCRAMLACPDNAIASFYALLARKRKTLGHTHLPFAG